MVNQTQAHLEFTVDTSKNSTPTGISFDSDGNLHFGVSELAGLTIKYYKPTLSTANFMQPTKSTTHSSGRNMWIHRSGLGADGNYYHVGALFNASNVRGFLVYQEQP